MGKKVNPLLVVTGCVLLLAAAAVSAEGQWQTGVVQSAGKGYVIIRGPDRPIRVKYGDKTVLGICITGQCKIGRDDGTISWRVPLTAPDGVPEHDDEVKYDMTLPCWCRLMFKHASQMKHMMKPAVDPKQFWWFDLSSAKLDPVTPDRDTRTLIAEGGKVPYMQGKLSFTTKTGEVIRDTTFSLDVDGDRFNVMMDGSGRLLGIMKPEDIKPFCCIARVFGSRKGNTIEAERIDMQYLGDFLSREKPSLPRCLIIGDAISFDYNLALRKALGGKVNLYHPPVDCGSVRNGTRSLHEWLGAWDVRGHGWDVIAFNFGQADTDISKKDYQNHLRRCIGQMKKTGAKLLWITTTPIPDGCGKVGDLKKGRIPGRKSGAVTKYLNPWAMEVVGADPDIQICDLWEVVSSQRKGRFSKWWKGWDHRFGGDLADPLGEKLAGSIVQIIDAGAKKKQ